MAETAENTTFNMADRGHEVEVIENYQSALNCVICSLIINKATHGCERHVFCEGCIKEYLTKSFEKECPICPGGCRKQIDPAKLSPNFTIDMLINKLKSKCSFKDCSWTGDLLDLVKDHRSQCNYATVKCLRNGCEESFLQEDTEKHDNICLYKYLQCSYCENDVLRMNKEDHETSCSMEKVKCIYHEVGCNNVMCRRDVDKHEHDYQSLHMKLSFQNNVRNEKRQEKLAIVVENSAEENRQLKQQINELKHEVSDVIEKSSNEMNQLKHKNNELREEVSKLKKEVTQTSSRFLFFKERRKRVNLDKIADIEQRLKTGGFLPNYAEIDDTKLILKIKMLAGHFVQIEKLLLLVKARNYDENLGECLTNAGNFNAYFLTPLKVIPYHWFDFTGSGLADNTQHVIRFPIKNNQIEDFFCDYNVYTVQSINNNMTVIGFPQGWIIKIVIDDEELVVNVEEEFNPFDTDKLKAAEVSGSGCIIILQK